MDQELPVIPDPEALRHFWQVQRSRARLAEAEMYLGSTSLGAVQPPAWAWGVTREEADVFAAQVLAEGGAVVVTPVQEYGDTDLPQIGTFSILCTGAGRPVALLAVEQVSEVGPEIHERFRVVKAQQ